MSELAKKLRNMSYSVKIKLDGLSEDQLNDTSGTGIPGCCPPYLDLILEVIERGYRIKDIYLVYRIGWEMDNIEVIAEKDEVSFLFYTDHGSIKSEILDTQAEV
jgi:hypothetical protein